MTFVVKFLLSRDVIWAEKHIFAFKTIQKRLFEKKINLINERKFDDLVDESGICSFKIEKFDIIRLFEPQTSCPCHRILMIVLHIQWSSMPTYEKLLSYEQCDRTLFNRRNMDRSWIGHLRNLLHRIVRIANEPTVTNVSHRPFDIVSRSLFNRKRANTKSDFWVCIARENSRIRSFVDAMMSNDFYTFRSRHCLRHVSFKWWQTLWQKRMNE